MKEIKVTKRDGSKQDFDVQKIKKSIAFACEKMQVNPLELESRIDQFIKNGIKTKDIQANIIHHAVQLATAQNPEWLQVAGNAFAMDEWNEYALKGKSLYDCIKYCIKTGEYTKEILDYYSKEDIDWLEKQIDPLRDLEHSYASLQTARKKYLSKNETNQMMHMLNAMRFGQMEPKATRLEFVKSTYDVLSLRKFSLATPFMLNLRSGGNTASCFILAVEDDLDSIFQNVHRVAKISKNGGGIGIFLGYIRAKGSSVGRNQDAAGSIVQWVKIFNDTLVAVNQGGKRAGAGTVALPIWHNDLDDFLNMQNEHGDLRLKAYDVFPQLVVPDIFMQRDQEQGKWITFCPFEVKNVLGIDLRGVYGSKFTEAYLQIEQAALQGKLKVFTVYDNARDITKQIMRTQFETGLPYLTFVDTVNEANPNSDDPEAYGIPSFNLCVAPETLILTDEGYQVISDLEGEYVNVWNGEEFSRVQVKKTAQNQKLIKVTTYSGKTLHCTPYHKFYNYAGQEIQASQLTQGTALLDWDCPDAFDNKHFTQDVIREVLDEGRYDDTYCFTEPKRHMGVFNGILTGQCTESNSNVKPDKYAHVCNLGSVNLANIQDFNDLAEVSKLACRILNRGIELTAHPDEITAAHNSRYRTIGIGVMGLNDYFAKVNSGFNDLELISNLFECIQYNAAIESTKIAEETGQTFGAYEYSKWKSGEMLEKYKQQASGMFDWDYLDQRIKQFGIYNSQLTSPAPTTTTSIYQDASASIQPIFKAFFAEDNKNGTIKVAAKYLKENPLAYGKTQPKFDAKEIIDVTAAAQKWVDTGISMELMFDQNKLDFKAKDLYDAIHYAWVKKCKAIYYIRSIKKNASLETKEDDCVACSG